MIPFNGNLAEQFPERTARNVAAVARHEATLKSADPFGGLNVEKSQTAVTVGRLCTHVPTGRIGRPTRFTPAPGSTFDSPDHVYFVPIDTTDGLGETVLLADLVPLDDKTSMSLEGRMRVATEARPDSSTNEQGRRETAAGREYAAATGNTKAALFSFVKRVQHCFSDGDRVVVHSPGHYHHGSAGKIIDDRNDTRMRIKLDSGHEIHAAESELIPESLAPVAASAKILKRAIAAGTVSVPDQVTIESLFEKISTGNFATDGFGNTLSDSPFHALKIFAEKYQASDNVLSKRTRTHAFKVGDTVKDIFGRAAKITGIGATHADLEYSPGVTGIGLLGDLKAE